MTTEQIEILVILAMTIAVFAWGRWRHDIVAVGCLMVCVFAGLVPATGAFSGFGHPAVITVACVLILSWGLQATGAVDLLAQRLLPTGGGPTLTIAAITGLGAVLSAFMNNVGALALLMPLAIQIAKRLGLTPGKVLMPLSFGTIVGGMTTLIGTPPNLIVSGFRNQNGSDSFGMFDFTPVGLAIAGAGIVFVALAGWRIVPARENQGVEGFDTGRYLTEARVTGSGKADGRRVGEVDRILQDADAQVVAMVRNGFRISAPDSRRKLREGDILIIEAEPESLSSALSSLGLKLEEHVAAESEADDDGENSNKDSEDADEEAGSEGASQPIGGELQELVVMPTSALVGRSVNDLRLRSQHGLILLALSRQGHRRIKRLRTTALQAGDVLLMQGAPGALSGFASEFGCVPLAARSISIPDRRKTILALAVMAAAISGAAFGLLPAAISFASGVLLFMVLGVIPLRRLYEAVDWPVIVLLGALIPVAFAMESTGAASVMARVLLDTVAQGHAIIALGVILVVTMTLSDFMNNAATAAVMCPVAISSAGQLGVNTDTFLMAVAVGASCAFLTPIGHQNNTLILGPGGFRFSDYWRLGLPMELIVVTVGIPTLLWAWPL
jgi:di/tricarboxylate transporter